MVWVHIEGPLPTVGGFDALKRKITKSGNRNTLGNDEGCKEQNRCRSNESYQLIDRSTECSPRFCLIDTHWT